MSIEFWRGRKISIADTPADGETASISSNWAYDHAALTTAHGISSFGSTLIDDANAATARSTLDLTHSYYLTAINFGALI